MRAQKAPVAPAGGGEGWSPAPSHLLSTAQRGDREIVRGSGYSEGLIYSMGQQAEAGYKFWLA